jgi:hypothetical protein
LIGISERKRPYGLLWHKKEDNFEIGVRKCGQIRVVSGQGPCGGQYFNNIFSSGFLSCIKVSYTLVK